MAEAVDMDKFRKMLECSICLEPYTNPKILKCDHEFCKQCIEDIAVFSTDGSATITCPFRCDKPTMLDKFQTVDDLGSSYVFKNILEALKSDKEKNNNALQVPQCLADTSCMKSSSLLCCGELMCSSCYTHHINNTDRNHCRVDVSLNHRKDKLMVLCDVHKSVCTHLSVDNQFLCMYCLHRDCHGQVINEVDIEVQLLRDSLRHASCLVQDASTSTSRNIHLAEEKLKKLVRQRKKQCLADYKSLLNLKEEEILERFGTLTSTQMEQYSNASPGHLETFIKKLDIEILLQKAEILDAIEEDRKISVPKRVNVSLSKSWNYLTENPLGELECVFLECKRKVKPPFKTNPTAKSKSSKPKRPSKEVQVVVLDEEKMQETNRDEAAANCITTCKANRKVLSSCAVNKSTKKAMNIGCNSAAPCKNVSKSEEGKSANVTISLKDEQSIALVTDRFCSENQEKAINELNSEVFSNNTPTTDDCHAGQTSMSYLYLDSTWDSCKLIDAPKDEQHLKCHAESDSVLNITESKEDLELKSTSVLVGKEPSQVGATPSVDITDEEQENEEEAQNNIVNEDVGSTPALDSESQWTELQISTAVSDSSPEFRGNETKDLTDAYLEGTLISHKVQTQTEVEVQAQPDETRDNKSEGDKKGMIACATGDLKDGFEESCDQLISVDGDDSGVCKENKSSIKSITNSSKRRIKVQKSVEVTMIQGNEDDIDALLDSLISKDDSKCNFRKTCKNPVTVVGQKCDLCFQMFCLTHRLPEVHGCGKAAKVQAQQNGSTNSPQRGSSVKTNDAKRRAKLCNKLSSKLSKLEDKRKKK